MPVVVQDEPAATQPEMIGGKRLCDLSELRRALSADYTVAAGSTPPILSFIRAPAPKGAGGAAGGADAAR